MTPPPSPQANVLSTLSLNNPLSTTLLSGDAGGSLRQNVHADWSDFTSANHLLLCIFTYYRCLIKITALDGVTAKAAEDLRLIFLTVFFIFVLYVAWEFPWMGKGPPRSPAQYAQETFII